MPKSKKFFQLITLFSLACSLTSCENNDSVVIENEKDKETTLNVSFSDTTFKYDGLKHSISIVGELPENVTAYYVGNSQSEVGDYSVSVFFTNTVDTSKKYKSLSAVMHIVDDIDDTSSNAALTNILFPDQTVTYSGNAVNLRVLNLPTNYSVTYSNNDDGQGYIEVGTYVVYASISDATGTRVFNKSAILTILPRSADIKNIRFDSKTFIYNGVNRSLEIEGTLPSYLTVQYSNNNQVEAGVYTVTATFVSSNPNIKAPSPMQATLRIVNELAHTVTFVDSNDNVISTIPNVIDGTTLSDESVPNLVVEAPTAYEKVYDESLISNIRSDVTVRVTYTLNNFKLTYIIPHGKTNENNTTSYNYTDFFSLSEPDVDKGYYFVGYYLDSNYTQAISAIDYHSYGDKILYARVDEIPPSGVVFRNQYKVYDGTPLTVVPTGNVLDTDKYTIKYYDNTGKLLPTAPINAGVYHMVMEYERLYSNNLSTGEKYEKLNDFTATLTIGKSVSTNTQFNITANSGVSFINNVYKREYSENDGVRLNISNLPSYLSYTVDYYDSNNNKLNSYPQNAGSYYARFRFSSDANHTAPDDLVENIVITKKTISLTDDVKKAVFADTTYNYSKGSTFSIRADLDKLPNEYKNIISVLRYQNEQRTSTGSQIAYVYLTTSNPNYTLTDERLEATLTVRENDKARNIKYYYKDLSNTIHPLTYTDSFGRNVDFSTKVTVGDKAPTITFSESMYSSSLSLSDGANFLGKDGFYYGWTQLNWELRSNLNLNGSAIEDSIIPDSGDTNTTYYMILSPSRLSINVNYYAHPLTSNTPTSSTFDTPNNTYTIQNTYSVNNGYKIDYFYLDPKNPLGSKVTEVDLLDYRADQTSTITIYPMVTAQDDSQSQMFNVYFKYKDSTGTVKDITYKVGNNSFLVPIGGVIPIMGEIEENGFSFSGWFIQDNENGRDVSTASKRLNSNTILTAQQFNINRNVYIYGELISNNYDVIINFEGEEAFKMTVGYKQKIFTDDQAGRDQLAKLNDKVRAYLAKHPEYDSTYSVVYRDSTGSEINITDSNYIFANSTDMILTATFEKASFYTKYEGVEGLSAYNQLNGGKGVKQIQDDVFILPTVKDKNGYSFLKWVLSSERGGFTSLDIYPGSIVNLSGIYSETNHGQLTLTAVYESNSYLTTFIFNDGVNSPITTTFAYEKSNFYLSTDGTQILTTDENGRVVVAFSAPERKGYTFVGFYSGAYKLDRLLDSLNASIEADNTLSPAEKEAKKRLFKFDYNLAITCNYEKITYQLRFYDNINHKITDETDDNKTYITELDNYYIVNYDDIFAIPSLASYSGMEGYKIDGFYLVYNTAADATDDNLLSNRIIDITTCSDNGDFKPSEIEIPQTGRPIINVYIKLAPKTYNLTLIEDTYTTVDTLHDSIRRTFKTKTVSINYKQSLADVIVDSYIISDGQGGYTTKYISLLDELPCKDGYEFDGWIVKTLYNIENQVYEKHVILGYQKDENGNYILDENGNKIRQLVDEDGNPFTYDYNFDYTLVANYKGNTLNVSYKYEIDSAQMVGDRYTGGTLTGDIDINDILDDLNNMPENKVIPGLPSRFDGEINYNELASQYTLTDAWVKQYVQKKNLNNTSLNNVYVSSWYYLRYDNYNKDTGEYDSISRIAITSSTTIKSTDKVDLVCTLTVPTSPVTFFDTLNNSNLAKPSTIHSNVPLLLSMTLEYRRDQTTGALTNEVSRYNYTLSELVDVSTTDYPSYTVGSIRSEFSIAASDSSSAYTFDGLTFNITYGNQQLDGTPSTITLKKALSGTLIGGYQYIFQPEYTYDDNGNIIGLSNNYISNPGTVVFSPSYEPRNNVRVAFYTSSDMNASTLFSTQYIRAGGTYTIPSSIPQGENGMVFSGWVLRGGDSSTLITSGTFTADSNTSNIIYYAKYEYTNVRITYRVGSEIVMVKQLRDGLTSSSQMYDKDTLNSTSIVIGGYEFNGNESYVYNETTHQGYSTDAGCVYNHYRITKWKVVDEDGNLVYTKEKYVRTGQTIFLSNLLNTTASNIYLEPYDGDSDSKVYVGIALTYNINNVSYGPYVVDEKVYFSPLEILRSESLLYTHGVRTLFECNYTTTNSFYSGQQVAIDFRNGERRSTVTFTGHYAYDTNDGTLEINSNGNISAFHPSNDKQDIWQSLVLPGYYFTTDNNGQIIRSGKILGIENSNYENSVFGKNGRELIRSVSFPTLEGAYTTIGRFAFAGCKNLTTITFNQFTTTIADMAFANCTNLRAFECPANLNRIGKGAFLNNILLKTVSFNNKLVTIDDGAFTYVDYNGVNPTINVDSDKLEELVLPLSLSKIGKLAFARRSALKNLSWVDLSFTQIQTKNFGSDLSIGDYAFAIFIDYTFDASTLENTQTSDDDKAFTKVNADSTEDLVLDASFDVASDCDSLEIKEKAMKSLTGELNNEEESKLTISFPRQLASIGVGAFKYRKGITSLKFYNPGTDYASNEVGASWTELSIGANAFRIVPYESKVYEVSSTNDTNKTSLEPEKGIKGYDDLNDVTCSLKLDLPGNVASIGDYAFAYRYDQLSFANTDDVFKKGNNIVPLNIGTYAFGGLRRYSSTNFFENNLDKCFKLNLPTRTRSIGDYAFYNRSDAKGMYIDNYTSKDAQLYSIGNYAFARLTKKDTTVMYEEGLSTLNNFRPYQNSNRYDPTNISTHNQYAQYVIHYVKSNGSDTISDNSLIDVYSDDIEQYLKYDFEDVTSVSSIYNEVTLPASLLSIGEGAFQFKTELKTLRFSNSQNRQLRTISPHAFEFCSNLETIENDLTDSVNNDSFMTLGEYAFRGCRSLRGTTTENSLTIPAGIRVIEEATFADCRSLVNINLGTSSTIRKAISNYAFYNCNALQTVDNNNNSVSFKNVYSVGYRAFENCTSLTSISFTGSALGYEINTDESASELNNAMEDLLTMKIPYSSYNEDDCNKYGANYIRSYSAGNYNYVGNRIFTRHDAYYYYNFYEDVDKIGINNYNEASNQDDPNTLSDGHKFNAMDYRDFSMYDLAFSSSNAKGLYVGNNLNISLSWKDYANGNFTFKYSPLGTRAFYKCSNAELDLGSEVFNNVYVLSNYVFAHIRRTDMTSTLRQQFPKLIDGNQDYSRLSRDDFNNYQNRYYRYLTAGPADLGYQGIIGIAPFLDGPRYTLANSEIYLRTKYIMPMGLAGVTLTNNVNLNRIGDDNKYININTIKENMLNIGHSVRYFEQERENVDNWITAESIGSYFDLNYTVTPYMFAGSTWRRGINIYVDGQLNEFGFAHFYPRGICNITTKSLATYRTPDKKNLYFGSSVYRANELNYIDITQNDSSLSTKPESLQYDDDKYIPNLALSLGLYGNINLATDFINSSRFYNGEGINLYISGFSNLNRSTTPVRGGITFTGRDSISACINRLTITGAGDDDRYTTSARRRFAKYLYFDDSKTYTDTSVPYTYAYIDAINSNNYASFSTERFLSWYSDKIDFNNSIGILYNESLNLTRDRRIINYTGYVFKTTEQATREFWAAYAVMLGSAGIFGFAATRSFIRQQRTSNLYYQDDTTSYYFYNYENSSSTIYLQDDDPVQDLVDSFKIKRY